jgi:hypothetical protein
VDDGIREAAAKAGCGRVPNIVHVADREADIQVLLFDMLTHGRSFVIRGQHNRRVDGGRARSDRKMFEVVSESPVLCTRLIKVVTRGTVRADKSACVAVEKGSGRERVAVSRWRKTRNVMVDIRAITTRVYPTVGQHVIVPREGYEINVVHVQERDAPEGVRPICWYLVTDQSIESVDDLQFIVETYDRRWIIEEYHKALKSGCRFEESLFRQGDRYHKRLAINIPNAVQSLRLRWFDRERGDASASEVLTKMQIAVIRAHVGGESPEFPSEPKVSDVTPVIARLGGYVKSKTPPGVAVLSRGIQTLQSMLIGFVIALQLSDDERLSIEVPPKQSRRTSGDAGSRSAQLQRRLALAEKMLEMGGLLDMHDDACDC